MAGPGIQTQVWATPKHKTLTNIYLTENNTAYFNIHRLKIQFQLSTSEPHDVVTLNAAEAGTESHVLRVLWDNITLFMREPGLSQRPISRTGWSASLMVNE